MAEIFHLEIAEGAGRWDVLLRLNDGRRNRSDTYRLRYLASDFGRAFALTKLGGDGAAGPEYAVLLDGERSTCDCLGFLRWGKCKHLAALASLFAETVLSEPRDS